MQSPAPFAVRNIYFNIQTAAEFGVPRMEKPSRLFLGVRSALSGEAGAKKKSRPTVVRVKKNDFVRMTKRGGTLYHGSSVSPRRLAQVEDWNCSTR